MGRTERIAQFNGRIANDGDLYLQQGFYRAIRPRLIGPVLVRSGSVQRFQPCRLFERLCPAALAASGRHEQPKP